MAIDLMAIDLIAIDLMPFGAISPALIPLDHTLLGFGLMCWNPICPSATPVAPLWRQAAGGCFLPPQPAS
jgi:hypothetical protein